MTATLAKVVLIEDERPIRRFLRPLLINHGFAVVEAETAREGLMLCATHQPDLVILDLSLPDGDGMDVIRQLREWSSTPVLVLSARGQETDKVAALDAGADDYLTKPFGVPELLARVRVAMRHATRIADDGGAPIHVVGNLRVDLARRLVFVNEQEVRLSPIEYKLLTTLVRHAGKVLTHKYLLKEVWGPESVQETHYLRVYMGHLRHKIEADPARPRLLLTEPGVGYRLAAE